MPQLLNKILSYSWASRILIVQREEEFIASLGTFDRYHNPTQHNDRHQALFVSLS